MYGESSFLGIEKVYMVVVLCHLSSGSEICLYSVPDGTILTESPELILVIGTLLVMLYRAQGKWQHLAINSGGGLTHVSYSVPS